MDSFLLVLNHICEEVQTSMASQPFNGEIEWNAPLEVLLHYAMWGHKPVGVNRYYMMTCIHDKFSSYINKQMSSKPIWDYLDSMYDMGVLHESEIIPFPNEEVDFELPANEFSDLVKEMLDIELPASDSKADIKSNMEKSGRKSGSLKPKQGQVPIGAGKSKVTTSSTTKGVVTVKSETSSNVESNTKVKVEATAIRSGKAKAVISPSVKVIKAEIPMNSPIKVQGTSDTLVRKPTAKQEMSSSSKKVAKEADRSDSTDERKGKDGSGGMKRNKSNVTPSNSKRSNKNEGNMSAKRKSDQEISSRRGSDSSSTKQGKTKKLPSSPQKYSRGDDTDSQSSVGSSKSGRGQNRNEQTDRKRKRLKSDELQSPKETPVKRRR